MRFEIGGDYRVSEEQFWSDVFFEPEFVNALHLDGLAYKRIEIVDDTTEPDGTRERILLAYPTFEVPGPLRRVLGSEIHYRELGSFDPDTRIWSTHTTLPRLGDKLLVRADMSFMDTGPGRCRRSVEFDVRIKVFGLGRILESFVKRTVSDAYEQARVFTNAWTDEHLQNGS